jgi:hypothetical protein
LEQPGLLSSHLIHYRHHRTKRKTRTKTELGEGEEG